MISNPKNGWCDFTLGDFYGTPSYITKVPIDLLNCFISYIENGCGLCWFDEEGSEFTLVINPYSVFIIEEKNDSILHEFSDITIENLLNECIEDIENNIEKWAWFDAFDEEEYIKNKEVLENKIKTIKKKGYK